MTNKLLHPSPAHIDRMPGAAPSTDARQAKPHGIGQFFVALPGLRTALVLLTTLILSIAGSLPAAADENLTYITSDNGIKVLIKYDTDIDANGFQYAYVCGIGTYENSAEVEVTIPSTLGGCPVKEIRKSSVFENLEDTTYESNNIVKVTLPASVEKLGYQAFEWFLRLHSIIFKGTIKSIGAEAFYFCYALTDIKLPDGLKTIEEGTFFGCSSLKNINLPEGLETIEGGAFGYCSSLTSISIPATVSNLAGWGTFQGCTNLTSVKFNGTGPKEIGPYTFQGCTKLDNVVLPSQINTIDKSAFADCSSLTKLTLGKAVRTIGDKAFQHCTSLSQLILPDSVTNIGSSAFEGCTSLSQIALPDSVTSISSRTFEGCTNLREVTVGENLQTIGEAAFKDCVHLNSAPLPNSLTALGDSAFYNCAGIKRAATGEALKSIGNYTFYGCTSLASANIGNKTKVIGRYAYANCTALKEFYIPYSVELTDSAAFSGCTSLNKVTICRNSAQYNDPFPKTVRAYYMADTPIQYDRYDTEKFTRLLDRSATIYAYFDYYDDYANVFKDYTVKTFGTLTISKAGYATYYVSGSYYLPEGLSAAVITGNEGDRLNIDYRYQAGDEIPVKTAVLVKGAPGDYDFEVRNSSETGVKAPTDNWLRGGDHEAYTVYDGDEDVYFYKLSYDNSGERLGFYWGAEYGFAFSSPGHKAYLVLPKATAAQVRGLALDDGHITGIGEVETTDPDGSVDSTPAEIYTISGVRLSATMTKGLPKGLYIVNGKKTVIK